MALLSAATPQGRQLMHHALKASPVFADWPVRQLDELVAAARLGSYAEDAQIPTGTDRLREVVVVVSGYLEISSFSPEGRRHVMALLGPGEVSGMVRLIDAPFPISQYRAKEATMLVHVPCATLRRLLDDAPLLWRDIALYALSRQRASVLAKHHFAVSDPVRLLASVLVELMERDVQGAHGRGAPVVRVGQAELAARMGRSRMTARKGLETLKSRKLVNVGYGHIDVLDASALRALAQ